MSILMQHAVGQTTSITAGVCATGALLHLLVIGTRGIIRLEGGEWFLPIPDGDQPATAAVWERAVTESLCCGGFVSVAE